MFLRIAIALSFLSVGLIPAATAQPKPKKYALFIGINTYNHAAMNRPQPLKYAEADATAAAKRFEDSGYEVTVITGEQATLKNIRDALKTLEDKGNTSGVVVVGLSGHGTQPEGSTEAYYCPFDVKMREAMKDGKPVLRDGKPVLECVPDTLLPLGDVLSALRTSAAGTKVLLADCCRNDPLSGRGRGVGSGMKVGDLPDNTAVFLACSKGQQAYEDKAWGGGHGAFFFHVLEGLGEKARDDEGGVSANRLADYLNRAVPKDVKNRLEGAEQDPFCLVSGKVDLQLTASGPRPGEEREFEIAEGTKMRFCWIPPGTAQLGSPNEEQDFISKTYHSGKVPVYLVDETEVARGKFPTKGFWLGKYEVTQAEWRAVMRGTALANPSYFDGIKDGQVLNMDRFPVESVSWNDCQEFLKKLNGRAGMKGRFKLPHEDEWEYACRGGLGNGRPFYFGTELNGTQANCDGNYPYGTNAKGVYKRCPEPVGSYAGKARHPWGLCDMHGNVWEWCDNKFDQSKDNRVLRGGSWNDNARSCRAAYRHWFAPDSRYSGCGCRILLSLDL